MPYSGDPSDSNLDMVRFLVGDTDNSALLLLDAEVTAMLTTHSSNVYLAAIACAEALAARFARKVDKSVGDLSISFSQSAKQFRDLAEELRQRAATSACPPYAGGISISDKLLNEANTDRVQPRFKRDMMAYESDSLNQED